MDKFEDASLGVVKVEEIHLSSRYEFETDFGEKIPKNSINVHELQNAFYTCNAKISLE